MNPSISEFVYPAILGFLRKTYTDLVDRCYFIFHLLPQAGSWRLYPELDSNYIYIVTDY